MSYALRNTILLGAMLLVIVLVGVYFLVIHYPGKVKNLTATMKQLDNQMQNTPDLVNRFNEATFQLGDMEKRWNGRSKDIPLVDVTSQTYAYLNRIIDLSGFVKMDMVYLNTQNRPRYGYNVYTLKGQGTFDNLYKFLWYIENGRRLYKINTITLKGNVDKKTDQIPTTVVIFEIELWAYFTPLPELSSSIGWRDTMAVAPTGDPFLAAIAADLPPNTRGLIDAEHSSLKAIISGKAFIVDQGGVMRTVTEGDEVFLGYVSRILPGEGKVEFALNKGGISEKYEMQIGSESSTMK